jgi:hypothetical protein
LQHSITLALAQVACDDFWLYSLKRDGILLAGIRLIENRGFLAAPCFGAASSLWPDIGPLRRHCENGSKALPVF